MTTPSTFPETINFYPLMGIQAARRSSHVGGGFRAWQLAKALDVQGLGMIKRDELEAFALSLGANVRTWRRWVEQARVNDLLINIQKGKDWYFILPSAGRAGLALGMVEGIGTRKATMPAAALIGAGWKARITSAWEDGKQITCEQIQKAINIPVSTQRLRRKQAGTNRQRNYSKSALKADKLTGIKEYTKHKAPFVMRDGFIAWRLPDTRYSTHAQRGGKGRARKANAFIRNSQIKGLSNMRRALSESVKPEFIRLFNLNETQLQATKRKISKRDIFRIELYQREHLAKSGAVMWKHCPLF